MSKGQKRTQPERDENDIVTVSFVDRKYHVPLSVLRKIHRMSLLLDDHPETEYISLHTELDMGAFGRVLEQYMNKLDTNMLTATKDSDPHLVALCKNIFHWYNRDVQYYNLKDWFPTICCRVLPTSLRISKDLPFHLLQDETQGDKLQKWYITVDEDWYVTLRGTTVETEFLMEAKTKRVVSDDNEHDYIHNCKLTFTDTHLIMVTESHKVEKEEEEEVGE